MKITEYISKKALPCTFVHLPTAKTISLQIWFRAGSSFELKQDYGLAHFLEHMFFKGTKEFPGAKIAYQVEKWGSELNAFTSFEYTCYYINCPDAGALSCLKILLEMITAPMFLNKDITIEREVVWEEYRRSLDNPSHQSFHQIQKESFAGGHAHPILGNEKTIKSFTKSQLVQFRKTYYNRSNAMLVVAGNLAPQTKSLAFQKLIDRYSIPVGPKSKHQPFSLKLGPQFHLQKAKVKMAQITLVFPAGSHRNEQTYAEELALTALCFGESSRLYQRLVMETLYANQVGASTMLMADGGCHFFRVIFPLENLTKVLAELTQVWESSAPWRFEEEDLTRIKNQYVASKLYEKEQLDAYAFSLGQSYALTGDIYFEQKYLDKLSGVPLDAVNSALHQFAFQSPHGYLQVPQETEDALAKDNLKQLQEFCLKTFNRKKARLEFSSSKSVQQLQVNNNLSLTYHHLPTSPTFAVHLSCFGGSIKLKDSEAGLFHLLSANQTNGTASKPYLEYKKFFETRAASIQAVAGRTFYGMTLHGQSKHFDELMQLFCETWLNPALPEEPFSNEKELHLRQLHSEQEEPLKMVFKAFYKKLYHNHPYGLPLNGTKTTVQAFQRNTLVDKFNLIKNQSGLSIAVSGDISLERVKKSTEILQTNSESIPLPQIELPATPSRFTEDDYIRLAFDREQSQIVLGKMAYPQGHPRDLCLRLVTTYLSGQSSPLFNKVRDEMGLCYSVAPIHFFAPYGGHFAIYMGSGKDKEKQAIDAIKDILSQLAKKGFTANTLKDLKQMMQGQFLLGLQTNEDYVSLYATPPLLKQPYNYAETLLKAVQKITLNEINHFMKEYFDGNYLLAVAGPNSI